MGERDVEVREAEINGHLFGGLCARSDYFGGLKDIVKCDDKDRQCNGTQVKLYVCHLDG